MSTHEYAILEGFNRSKLGRLLAILAGGVSAVLVLIVLSLVDVAKGLGLSVNLPPSVLSLVGAGVVFVVIYWLFNNFLWRWKWVGQALRAPNIAGTYVCAGETLGPPEITGTKWSGEINITQTWDKIRVHLKTAQSTSSSIAAAVEWDASEGFRLLYHYRNDPRMGEVTLDSHRGFADILFKPDLSGGYGEYFNGQGRFTFGKMHLTRKING